MAQTGLKIGIVTDALRRTGRFANPVVVAGEALATEGFRTSARLVASADGRLGYRAARSHDVVVIDRCLIAHDGLADLVTDIRADPGTEVSIRVSVATGERTAFAVDGAIRRAPAGVTVGADASLKEIVDGQPLRVSAASFFQSRTDGAEALVRAVRAAAGDVPGPLLDAYGGVGLFAATLGDGHRVTIVESSASSIADARHNLPDVRVIEADVAKWPAKPAALVIADPPRTGLGLKASSVIASTNADRIVLVSCDPVAGARDLAALGNRGYLPAESTVLDLFPHTPHVEIVTRCDRI